MTWDCVVLVAAVCLALSFLILRSKEIGHWIGNSPTYLRYLSSLGALVAALWVVFAGATNFTAYRDGFRLRLVGEGLNYAPLTVMYYPVGSLIPVNKFYALSDALLTSAGAKPVGLRYLGGPRPGDELSIRSIEVDGESKPYELLLRENPLLAGRDRILLQPFEELTIAGITRQARISVAPRVFGGQIELLLGSDKVGGIPVAKERVAGKFLSFDMELTNLAWERDSRGREVVTVNFPATGMAVARVEVSGLDPKSLEAVKEATFESIGRSPAALSIFSGGLRIIPSARDFNTGLSGLQVLCMLLAPLLVGVGVFASGYVLERVVCGSKSRLLQLGLFSLIFVRIISLVLSDVWPGAYTADSFIYPGIERGLISNYKPVLYTVFLGILRCFSTSPAFPLIVQSFIASVLLGALCVQVLKRGRLGWLGVLGAALVLSVSPVFPLYLVTLWKDIPYGICISLVLIALFALKHSAVRVTPRIVYGVIAPLLVVACGMRHTGIVTLGVIAVIAYLSGIVGRAQASRLLLLCIGMSYLFSSAVNVCTDSKSRTEYARMTLFPYIMYASYLPLRAHLETLKPEDAIQTRAALEKIASVDDFNGIDLMFSPEKVNFGVSDQELSAFKLAVLRGVFSNPWHFCRELIIANWRLLSGAGYIWDRGFLPLHRRLAFNGTHYFPEEYVMTPGIADGKVESGVARWLEGRLNARGESDLTSLIYSYIPHLLILVVATLAWRWAPAAALFAFGSLAAYLGVFLMPASMEFRYGFHLMVSAILCPLLIVIDWRSEKRMR